MMGRSAEAEEMLVRALEEPIPGQNVYGNLLHAQWNVGKPEAAWATHEAMLEAFPEASNQYRDRAWLLAAQGQWSEAHDASEQDIAHHPGQVTTQLYGGTEIAGADLGRGRYAEAMEHLARADRNALAAQAPEVYMAGPAWVHVFAALALSDPPTAAREALEHIAEIAHPEGLSPRGSAWRVMMGLHALAGDSRRGDEMLQQYEDVLAPEERGFQYRSATAVYAALRAFGTGDYAAAAAAFDIFHGEVISCGTACIYQAVHGIALEETGRPVEAIEQYHAFLTHGPLTWHAYLSAWTPTVLERLAGLYEAQGDTDEAPGHVAADRRSVQRGRRAVCGVCAESAAETGFSRRVSCSRARRASRFGGPSSHQVLPDARQQPPSHPLRILCVAAQFLPQHPILEPRPDDEEESSDEPQRRSDPRAENEGGCHREG